MMMETKKDSMSPTPPSTPPSMQSPAFPNLSSREMADDAPDSPLQVVAQHLAEVKLEAVEKIHSLKSENSALRRALEIKTDENRLIKQKLHVKETIEGDEAKRTLDFSDIDDGSGGIDIVDSKVEDDDGETTDPIAVCWNLGNNFFNEGDFQAGVEQYTTAAKMLVSNMAAAEAKANRCMTELEELSMDHTSLEDKLKEERAKAEELKKSVATLEEAKATLLADKANVDMALEDEKRRAAEEKSELESQLKAESAKVLEERAVLESNLKAMEVDFERKQSKLQEELEELKSDNFRLVEIESANASLRAELSTLQETMASYKSERESAQQESTNMMESLEAEKESLQELLAELEAKSKSDEASIGVLQQEKAALENSVAELQNEIEAKTVEAQQLVSVQTEQNSKILELESEVAKAAALSEEVEAVKKALVGVEADSLEWKMKYEESNAGEASLRAQVDEQQQQLLSLKSEQEAQSTQHFEEVERLTAELADLRGSAEQLESMSRDATTHLNRVNSLVEELDAAKAAHNEELHGRDNEIDQLRDEVSTLSNQMEAMEEELRSDITAKEQLNQILNDKLAESLADTETMNQLKLELAEKENELELLRQNAAVEAEASVESEEMLSMRQENEALAKRASELEAELEQRVSKFRKLAKKYKQTQNEDFVQRMMESERDLKFLVEEQAGRIQMLESQLQALPQKKDSTDATHSIDGNSTVASGWHSNAGQSGVDETPDAFAYPSLPYKEVPVAPKTDDDSASGKFYSNDADSLSVQASSLGNIEENRETFSDRGSIGDITEATLPDARRLIRAVTQEQVKEVEQMHLEIEQLKRENASLVESMEEDMQARMELEVQLDNLKAAEGNNEELSLAKAKVEELLTTSAEYERNLSAATQQVTSLRSELEANGVEVEKLRALKSDKEREVEYLTEQFKSLEELIVQEKEERKRLQMEIDSGNNSVLVAGLKVDNVELEQEMEDIKSREISRVAELESQSLSLKSQLAEVQSEVLNKDAALMRLCNKWTMILSLLKRMEFERDRALDEAIQMYTVDQHQSSRSNSSEQSFQIPDMSDGISAEPEQGWIAYIDSLATGLQDFHSVSDWKGFVSSKTTGDRALEEKCRRIELENMRRAETVSVCQEIVGVCHELVDGGVVEQMKRDVFECLEIAASIPPKPVSSVVECNKCAELSAALTELERSVEEVRASGDEAAVQESAQTQTVIETTTEEQPVSDAQELVSAAVAKALAEAKERENEVVAKAVEDAISEVRRESEEIQGMLREEKEVAERETAKYKNRIRLRDKIFGYRSTHFASDHGFERRYDSRIATPIRGNFTHFYKLDSDSPVPFYEKEDKELAEQLAKEAELAAKRPEYIPYPHSDIKKAVTVPPQHTRYSTFSVNTPQTQPVNTVDTISPSSAANTMERERSFADSSLPVSKEGESGQKKRSNSGKTFVSKMFGVGGGKIEAEASLSDNNSDFASEEEDPENKPKAVNAMSDPFTAGRAPRSRSSTSQSQRSHKPISPILSPQRYPVRSESSGPPVSEQPPPLNLNTYYGKESGGVAPAPPAGSGPPGSVPQPVHSPSSQQFTSEAVPLSGGGASAPPMTGVPSTPVSGDQVAQDNAFVTPGKVRIQASSVDMANGGTLLKGGYGTGDNKADKKMLQSWPILHPGDHSVSKGAFLNPESPIPRILGSPPARDTSEVAAYTPSEESPTPPVCEGDTEIDTLRKKIELLEEERELMVMKFRQAKEGWFVELSTRQWREKQHSITLDKLEMVCYANTDFHEQQLAMAEELQITREKLDEAVAALAMAKEDERSQTSNAQPVANGQYDTQYNTEQYNTEQYNEQQYNEQYNANEYTAQEETVDQYNGVQYNSDQYNSEQYSPEQNHTEQDQGEVVQYKEEIVGEYNQVQQQTEEYNGVAYEETTTTQVTWEQQQTQLVTQNPSASSEAERIAELELELDQLRSEITSLRQQLAEASSVNTDSGVAAPSTAQGSELAAKLEEAKALLVAREAEIDRLVNQLENKYYSGGPLQGKYVPKRWRKKFNPFVSFRDVVVPKVLVVLVAFIFALTIPPSLLGDVPQHLPPS